MAQQMIQFSLSAPFSRAGAPTEGHAPIDGVRAAGGQVRRLQTTTPLGALPTPCVTRMPPPLMGRTQEPALPCSVQMDGPATLACFRILLIHRRPTHSHNCRSTLPQAQPSSSVRWGCARRLQRLLDFFFWMHCPMHLLRSGCCCNACCMPMEWPVWLAVPPTRRRRGWAATCKDDCTGLLCLSYFGSP